MKIIKRNTITPKTKNAPEENKLETEFQSIITSIHRIDLLSLNPKFSITKGHVIPKGILSILLSIFGALITISSHVIKLFLDGDNAKFLITWHLWHNAVFHTFYHVIMASIVIVRRKEFASFILKLNKVYKLLNKKDITVRTWRYLVLFIAQYFAYLAYGRQYNIPVDISKLAYFVNFLFAIFTMKLLSVLMEKWREMMEECGRQEHVEDELVDQLFQCYVSLIEGYGSYRALMQEMILLHVVELTDHNILNLGIMFSASRFYFSIEFTFKVIIVLVIRVTRDFVMLITLIYYSEKFYSGIESIQNTCRLNVSTLDRDTCGKLRRVCKKIDRMCRYEFQKIHLCGLFPLDVTLLIGIISLLSTYVLVVLQFSFLYLMAGDRDKPHN